MAKAKKKATYEEYLELVNEHCGEVKKDVFTGDLCYYNKTHKEWQPVLSDEMHSELRSFCHLSDSYYSPTALQDHILRMQKETKQRLLINIPKWDQKRSRLDEISAAIKCNNLPPKAVNELLKMWGARMFERLTDPAKQNRILLIKGDQGAGKDYLVRSLLGHLGQYLVPFIISQQERDAFAQLCSGLVMHIAEYDRTNRTEVSVLKNMITAERASFRGAYERKAVARKVRASWIATCNVDNMLRDHTGNRRYIIFDIDRIEWGYPDDESEQVLAEWWYLAQQGYTASEETEALLQEHVEQLTPSDPNIALLEDYNYRMASRMCVREWTPGCELNELFADLSKEHKMHPHVVRSIIKAAGYWKRTKKGTLYTFEPESLEDDEASASERRLMQ